MPKIKVLDRNMINMIAAGEVIERPASIVKELVENSIDAGGTQIDIVVADGGKQLVSVTDNGCGMDAEDIITAFEPHATSKLSTVEDLSKISTMGFRGEALASIAAVAKVSITSRQQQSISANKFVIDCGVKQPLKPAGGAVGTTIEVKNLFYKLPARRKFLKTTATEMAHITEQLLRIALCYTNIGFTLTHNKKQLYNLTAGQSVRQRIEKLFDAGISQSLIEIECKEKGLSISAFAAKPDTCRASSKYQYFFLNGRYIRDKILFAAVKEAYRGLTEPNKYPVVFIFLELPAQSFDVNVHPTKTEVRFFNSNLVYSQLLGVLKNKLMSLNIDVPAYLPEQSEYYPNTATQRQQAAADAMADFFANKAVPSVGQKRFDFSSIAKKSDDYARSQRDDFISMTEPVPSADGQKYIQIHNSYILAETQDGFMVIDQHALHERIIYERLCKKFDTEKGAKLQSQKLLLAETFQPTAMQKTVLESSTDMFGKLGIVLEPFGVDVWAIQAFPTLLKDANPVEFVSDVLDMLAEQSEKIDSQRILHKLLDMTSCKAAVKAGQKLSDTEIEQLISDKTALQSAIRCPHGRPTVLVFDSKQLEKQFKRT